MHGLTSFKSRVRVKLFAVVRAKTGGSLHQGDNSRGDEK